MLTNVRMVRTTVYIVGFDFMKNTNCGMWRHVGRWMSTSGSAEPVPLFSGYMNKHVFVILLLIEQFAVDLDRCFWRWKPTISCFWPAADVLKKVHFTPERTTKVQSGSRGIALFFVNVGARWGWVVDATPRPLYPGNDPITIVWVGGCAPSPPRGYGKSPPPQRHTIPGPSRA